MNNTTNRIKKRADILTEYIVDRVERLERANYHYQEDYREERERAERHFKRVMGYTMPFNQTLNNIENITKDKNGVIIIKDKNGLTYEFATDIVIYPIIEKLLKEYEDRGECLKARPLTKGE
jgi:hypothetical protein